MRDIKKEVEGFLKLVANDKKLQEIVKKVDTAISKSKEEGEKVAKEELIPAAKERGFSFNEKEFLDYVSTAEKSLSSFSSQGGEDGTGKKSKFGGGKIGKLALLIGGGASVGIGGVAAFRHFNQPKKADVAQVQTLEQKDQENENKGEGEIQNDGLRSEEVKDQAPGENSEKTSDKLKEELEKHNENKGDTPAAPPAAGKTDEGNKPAAPPSLSKEQKIKLVDEMLDKIINNVDGALDKGIEEARKMGQEVNKEEVIKAYKELREKGTEEQKLQMYNMIVGQMLG